MARDVLISTPVDAAETARSRAPVEVAGAWDNSHQRVWVVLPVFNEVRSAERVAGEVAAFAAEHPEYRFIVVDDGSGDGTRAAFRAAVGGRAGLDDRVRVVGYRVNAGKGFAIQWAITGLEEGDDDDVLIFTDGDLAYALDHLPALREALGRAEVAIGSRRGPDGGYRAHPMRYVMGWTYNRLARWCLGVPYRDTQAGLKGFRLGAARRIFGALRVSGFAFDVEVLYLAR